MDVFENENNDLKELFENASLHARSLVAKLNSEDLLYLYARFKRVIEYTNTAMNKIQITNMFFSG